MKTIIAVLLTLAFTSSNPAIRDTLFNVVHTSALYIAKLTDGHQTHKPLFKAHIEVPNIEVQ